MKNTKRSISALLCLGLLSSILIGCQDNDRKPTAAEGAAADTKRQEFIDKLDLPADQKAKMKAQMGGPSAPDPGAAARAVASGKPADSSGRRN